MVNNNLTSVSVAFSGLLTAAVVVSFVCVSPAAFADDQQAPKAAIASDAPFQKFTKPRPAATASAEADEQARATMQGSADVVLENKSTWAIHHIYLSPQHENTWGDDQLGEATEPIVESGESFLLKQVPFGLYDVKIVDEDGDACVVAGVRILSNREFILSDEMLVSCEVNTEYEGLE